MEAIGKITIEEGLILYNPTMGSKGISERFELDELTLIPTDVSLGFWLKVNFKGEGQRATHSRSYQVFNGESESDFIANHKLLKQFK